MKSGMDTAYKPKHNHRAPVAGKPASGFTAILLLLTAGLLLSVTLAVMLGPVMATMVIVFGAFGLGRVKLFLQLTSRFHSSVIIGLVLRNLAILRAVFAAGNCVPFSIC
jgi:hypothetical protein